MGPSRTYGAPKITSLFANLTIPAGAKTFTVAGLQTSGWRVGDLVCRPSTDDYSESATSSTFPQSPATVEFDTFDSFQGWPGPGKQTPATGLTSTYSTRGNYAVSKHIYARITDITGNQLTLDTAMDHDQIILTGTINGVAIDNPVYPEIIMLSGSITERSADPFTRLNRFHQMVMHPDYEEWYVARFDMGQSAIDASLTPPADNYKCYTKDPSQGGTLLADPLNVIGKYAHHLHFTGAQLVDRLAITFGSKCSNPAAPFQGVGMRSHGSRHAVESCAIVDFTAIGWSSEMGSEISQVCGNVVVGCTGDGYPIGGRHLFLFKHMGHAGCAYENQSRVCYAKGNRSYGCVESWEFVQQLCLQAEPAVANYNLSTPSIFSMAYLDPLTYGQGQATQAAVGPYTGYGQKDPAMPIFDGNISIGCKHALNIWEREATDRCTSIDVLFSRNHSFGCEQPVTFEKYVNNYFLVDTLHTRQTMGAEAAVLLGGAATWAITHNNVAINNFTVGFLDSGILINYDGFWYDIDFQNCPTHFQQQHINPDGDPDPRNNAAYGLMGEWYDLAWNPAPATYGGGVYARKWVNLTDADLNKNGKVGSGLPQAANGRNGSQYSGVDPRPANQQGTPGFYIDPSSIFTLDYVSKSQYAPAGGISNDRSPGTGLSGAIIDGLGVRSIGGNLNNQLLDTGNTADLPTYHRNIGTRTAAQFITHSGLWIDGGTPRVRVHLLTHDRKTKLPLRGAVDLPIINVPADVLATAQTDPDATMLKDWAQAEILRARPIVLPTTGPTITSDIPAKRLIQAGQTVLIPLQSDRPWTVWSLGGADAASFDTALMGSVWMLRFAGGAVATPGDYHLTITANDPIAQTLTTVSTRLVASAQYLEERFDYQGNVTAHNTNWYDGVPAQPVLISNGDGTATFVNHSGGFIGWPCGSNNNFTEFTIYDGGTGSSPVITLSQSYQAWTRFEVGVHGVGVIRSGGSGDYHPASTMNAGDKYRWELNDGIVTLTKNDAEVIYSAPAPGTNADTSTPVFSGDFTDIRITGLKIGPLI